MARFVSFVLLAISLISSSAAFPAHVSLAGLSRDELDKIIPRLEAAQPENPPPPLAFNGTKLVNDAQHPWMPLKNGDMRGPCPGLNTLASHGVSHYKHCAGFEPDLNYVLSIFLVMASQLQSRSSTPSKKVRKSRSSVYRFRIPTLNAYRI
jgi:hypothetical protein